LWALWTVDLLVYRLEEHLAAKLVDYLVERMEEQRVDAMDMTMVVRKELTKAALLAMMKVELKAGYLESS
jgi:hypothetical protein